MRVFFGMILGCALTVGGAYIADKTLSGPGVLPMVNWEIVAKNVDGMITLARDGWKKLTG
jgi:hypothetical protein